MHPTLHGHLTTSITLTRSVVHGTSTFQKSKLDDTVQAVSYLLNNLPGIASCLANIGSTRPSLGMAST